MNYFMASQSDLIGIGLSSQERAYLLDKIGNCSYFVEKFGDLSPEQERKLIVSIFLKLQKF